MSEAQSYQRRLRLTRPLTLVGYLGLIGWLTAWSLWLLPPDEARPWLIWLLRCLPLIAFAPVFWLDQTRGYEWLSFVLIFYLASAVADLFLPYPAALLATVEVVWTSALFVLVMFHIRWQKHAAAGQSD